MTTVITLDQAKAICRIGSGTAYDAPLTAQIEGAEQWIANHLGTAWSVTTQTEYHDGGSTYLWLMQWPVVSITSITDTLSGTALASTAYQLLEDDTVMRTGGVLWSPGAKRYTVEYTYGYTSQTVPAGIKCAMLALIRRAWENAQMSTQTAGEITQQWDRLASGEVMTLLRPYRRGYV